jgi:hypothetical protein
VDPEAKKHVDPVDPEHCYAATGAVATVSVAMKAAAMHLSREQQPEKQLPQEQKWWTSNDLFDFRRGDPLELQCHEYGTSFLQFALPHILNYRLSTLHHCIFSYTTNPIDFIVCRTWRFRKKCINRHRTLKKKVWTIGMDPPNA